MDLVTVTFSNDLALMKLQANSIDRFIAQPCVHWVVIEDDVFSMEKWASELSPYYTRHTLKLLKNDLVLDRIGWIRQQVLKLTIADKIDAEFYLILDSKVFFVRPVDLDTFPLDEGDDSLFDRVDILYEKWGEWLSHVERFTGKSIPNSFWRIYPPFRVKTSSVKNMLHSTNVPKLFSSPIVNQSEFLLYRFYSNATPCSKVKSHHIFRTLSELPTRDDLTELINNQSILSFAIKDKLAKTSNSDLTRTLKEWLMEHGYDIDVVRDVFAKQ
jgi:hypothetical protein